MALSEDYVRWLTDLFTITENHPRVSEWEKKFLTDQRERFEEHGASMHLSDKQKAVLMKIDGKIND